MMNVIFEDVEEGGRAQGCMRDLNYNDAREAVM
jgi:hypothetical protein